MKRFLLLLGWLTICGLLTPLLVSVWISFSADSFLTPPLEHWSTRWYEAFADNPRWMAALGRSLIVAAFSTLLIVPAGAMLAGAVVRFRFIGRQLLMTGAVLPVCLPPVVLGMGLLPLLNQVGLRGHSLGLILTHALLSLPLVYLILKSHFEQTSEDLEQAARGLGANRWQTLRRVTIPLAIPAFLAAAAGAFVSSLNEAMVSLFLVSPATETLPTVMWPELRYSASPLVAVASTISTLLTLAGVAFLWKWNR